MPMEPSTPTDIGHCVAWLCSDYARLITGCDFVIDGGARAKYWGYTPPAEKAEAGAADSAVRGRDDAGRVLCPPKWFEAGAVQTGPLAYEIREFPRPVIGPDDGLLRVEACGVCGSDVEQYRGHLVRPGMFPLIPGHEPLGVVEEVGRTGGGALGRSGGRSRRGRDPAALPRRATTA